MHRVIHLLFAFAVLSAADDGQTSCSLLNPVRPDPGRGIISITPLGSYAITFTTSLLGIDDMGDNSDVLIAIDSLHENVVAFEGLSGTYIGALFDLHPDNADAFGICFNVLAPYLLTNDCSDTGLFLYSGVWSVLDNPAGDNGMGMECDGTWCWQVVSDGALHRLLAWQSDGTTLWYDVSAYIPGQLVGCACFWDPLQYVAVTCESSDDIYVFQIDGSSCIYIGSADLSFIPGDHSDLAYCEYVDRFFLSYTLGYACNIAMFEMDISVPLERGTWAGIKSAWGRT